MKKGIHIGKILVTGDDMPDATVTLESGLNLISGPSDTGKSYIFDLIDFLLGGKTLPRPIPQAEGYSLAALEGTDCNGNIFSLFRNLSGGPFTCYASSISDSANQKGLTLKPTYDAKTQDNISSYLLKAMGVDEAQMRHTEANKLKPLSVRDVFIHSLIDEAKIIDKISPMATGRQNLDILDRAVFEFFLTGRDSSNLDTDDPLDMRVGAWQARGQVYDEILSQIEKDIAEKTARLTLGQDELEAIDQRIVETRKVMEVSDYKIQEVITERSRLFEEKQRLESRLLISGELIPRFQILKRQYESDLRRLTFIYEASHYFGQLTALQCPFCDRPMNQHEYDDACEKQEESIDSMRIASQRETAKINAHLADLQSTMDTVEEEIEKGKSELTLIDKNISDVESQLQRELNPTINRLGDELVNLIEQRELFVEIRSERKRREILQFARKTVGEKPKRNRSIQFVGSVEEEQKELAAYIKEILSGWDFPIDQSVMFDKKSELVVDNEPRGSHGKGVRAVFHAAYTIGLMRYCLMNDKPHAGFVVLDSPIDAFHAAKGQDAVGPEKLKQALRQNFYEYLSLSARDNEQIIIIENNDYDPQYPLKINFVKYTGMTNQGRYGFYPVKGQS